ncbi:MAG: hypothetical protein ACUZ8N_16570 [Candidatus Scalindua sp.]
MENIKRQDARSKARQKTDTLSADRQGISPGQTAPRASKRHELTLMLKAKDIFNAELAENTEEKDKKIYGFSHLDLKP